MSTGDFLQLPAVLDVPLYGRSPPQKKNDKFGYGGKNESVCANGRMAWDALNTVVILTENMRARDDPGHASMVRDIRIGKWTEDYLGDINSRLVERNHSNVHSTLGAAAPVVVTTNEQREVYTKIVTHSVAQQMAASGKLQHRPVRVFANVSVMESGQRSRRLSREEHIRVLSTTYDKMGRIAPVMDIFEGQQVVITQRLSKSLGAVNGTRAEIAKIVFPADTTFRAVPSGLNNGCHWVTEAGSVGNSEGVIYTPSKPPLMIILHLRTKTGGSSVQQPDDGAVDFFKNSKMWTQAGYLPTFSQKHGMCSNIKAKPDSGTLVVKGFGFVPAAVSTAHRLQGMTLKALIVGPWRSKANTERASAYVVISRLLRTKDLHLLEPLTRDDTRYFRPCADALDHEIELLKEATETLKKYEKGPWANSELRAILETERARYGEDIDGIRAVMASRDLEDAGCKRKANAGCKRKATPTPMVTCEWCRNQYQGRRGLSVHQRKCKRAPNLQQKDIADAEAITSPSSRG